MELFLNILYNVPSFKDIYLANFSLRAQKKAWSSFSKMGPGAQAFPLFSENLTSGPGLRARALTCSTSNFQFRNKVVS